AAGGECPAWFARPGGVAREGVVGVPDDRAGAAEAAELLVGEPFAGDPVAVPELFHARVVEYVAVPGGAGVAGEHRQPDREHGQLRVRVRVEDVRADPTGPKEADASGRAEEHDQSWLIGRVLERGLQLADGVQVGEPLLRGGRRL